jgi:hypothetical protein
VGGKSVVTYLLIFKMMNSDYFVRFEVFTAVTMKNVVFWDVTPCGSCKKRCFGATATCQRILVPTFVDRGVSRGQSGGSSTAVNLSFPDRSRYFSFK